MRDHEKPAFGEIMGNCAICYRQEINKDLIAMYWAALEPFTLAEISSAFNAHVRRSKFFPAIAEIIELIPSAASYRHIGPDEAWTIALAAMDEFETVVWTKEIAEAKAIAQDVYDAGDKIAARMAFKSAYERIVQSAGRPVWFVTEGFDADRRAAVAQQAVERGLLPAETLQRYRLSAPASVSFAQLVDMAAEHDEGTRKKALGVIHQILEDDDQAQAIARRERERLEFEDRRQQQLARAESVMREKGEAGRVH